MAICFTFAFPANGKTIDALSTNDNNSLSSSAFSIKDSLNANDEDDNSTNIINVKVSKISNNSATISWKSNNIFQHFTVYQYDFILGNWSEYKKICYNKIKIKNLSAGMFYKFKVVVSSPTGDNSNNLLDGNAVGLACFFTKPVANKIALDEYAATYAKISWDVHSGTGNYQIYRSKSGGKFKKIATISNKHSSFEDNDLEAKKYYSYKIINTVSNANASAKSDYSNTISFKTGKSLKLPKIKSKNKTYAYYDAVTDKTSAAYAVLNSVKYKDKSFKTTTDKNTGIRMVDDCYCCALATFYGKEKGTKYKVTLSTGKTFKIILCDTKSDRHTDKKHQYSKKNKDMLEFYVDKTKIPKEVNGNYNVLKQFNGVVTGIELINEQ